jgi:meso-butanediol dehydrogenase/(S,S)-butanediol dehydrogenase/diacetyl reductase
VDSIIVTGACGVIGEAFVRRARVRGSHLVLTDINFDALERLKDSCRLTDNATTLLAGDLSDEALAESLVEVACAKGRLAATVNIAGIHGPVATSTEVPLDDFRRTLEINVLALTKLCQLSISEFVSAETHGRIVNIASGAAVSGASLMMAYNSSKHAVLGVTRCLAKEFATRGIAVNAVCPGYVASQMVDHILDEINDAVGTPFDPIPTIPAGRMATPDEVANVMEYLTFDAPDYLTGTAMLVDGGLYA